MTRVCAGCPALLARRPHEHRGDFASRRYCSAPCATESIRKPITLRQCERCSRDIPRQPGTRPLRPHEYARRRFCSITCYRGEAAKLPPVAVVREEFEHFAGYSTRFTAGQLAEKLHVPAWYVEQAVAS